MGALTSRLAMLGKRILCALFAPFPARRPRVLLYHGVDSSGSPIALCAEVFAAQMEWLAARGFATWPASVYVKALRARTPLPRRLVVITFDDGYANNLDCALPELERRGFVATCFVVTGDLGGPARWEERDRERIAKLTERVWARESASERAAITAAVHESLAAPLASLDRWSAASARGFEIASHTQSHRFCDQEPQAVVEVEITAARAALQAVGATGAEILAWPYGAADDRTCALASRLGVLGAFAAQWEWSRRDDQDLFRINRTPLDPRLGAFGIAWVCSRGYELWALLRAFRRGSAA